VQPSAVPTACTARQASPPPQAPHRLNAPRLQCPPGSSAPPPPRHRSLMLASPRMSRLLYVVVATRQSRDPAATTYNSVPSGAAAQTPHHCGRCPHVLRRLVGGRCYTSSGVPPPVPPHSLRSPPAQLRTAGASGHSSASRSAARFGLAYGSPSRRGGSAASQAPPVLPPAHRSHRLRPSARP
jgi:hypothetical protein